MSRPAEHKPEDILATAVAVFRDRGVRTSTANIAAAAGVSNGTLFNYFPTKQVLIDQLYLWIKADLAEAIGRVDSSASTRRQLHTVWERWLGWAHHHRDAHTVLQLLHQAGLAGQEARVRGVDLLGVPLGVLTRAHHAGQLVALPLPYLVSLVQHQLDQAVSAELKGSDADTAFGVLWNGITARDPQPAIEGTQP